MREIARLHQQSTNTFGGLPERIGSEMIEVYPEDISDLSEDLHRDYECFSSDDDATARAIQFTEDGEQHVGDRRIGSYADN